MLTARLLCLAGLMAAASTAQAQKPIHLQLNDLLSQMPLPATSEGCYASCNTTHDQYNGTMVKDSGPKMMGYLTQINNYMTGKLSTTPTSTTPSAVPKALPPSQVNVMKEISNSQAAMATLTSLLYELGGKMGQLKMNKWPLAGSCPAVGATGYNCPCERDHLIQDEKGGVSARDALLQQQLGLLREYLPKFQAQLAIIDKTMVDGNYGEGMTDPIAPTMLYMLQQRGLGFVGSVGDMSNGMWTDAAKQYVMVVNAMAKTCP